VDGGGVLIIFPESGPLWVVLYYSERVREKLRRQEEEAWCSVLAVSEQARRNAE